MEKITLKYGSRPLKIKKPKNLIQILQPPKIPAINSVDEELKRALFYPIGTCRLKEMISSNSKIAIIICDWTRVQPRNEMLDAVLKEIEFVPEKNITIFVGTGTHPAQPIEELNLKKEYLDRFKIVVHNCDDHKSLCHIGRSSAGNEIYLNEAVVSSDVIIATGVIKPHYFAGYSGGAKSILPAVAGRETILNNHSKKTLSGARFGCVDGNPVRQEMEEAAKMISHIFIFNVVYNAHKEIIKAVAGDYLKAHREGVKYAKKACEVPAKKSDIVIISDGLPISLNVYQASKLAPVAGMILNDNGVVILACECPQGIGPIEYVNSFIYEMGVKPYLPKNHHIFLVSDLPEEEVRKTYCIPVNSIESALQEAFAICGNDASVSIIPQGGDLIPIAHQV